MADQVTYWKLSHFSHQITLTLNFYQKRSYCSDQIKLFLPESHIFINNWTFSSKCNLRASDIKSSSETNFVSLNKFYIFLTDISFGRCWNVVKNKQFYQHWIFDYFFWTDTLCFIKKRLENGLKIDSGHW